MKILNLLVSAATLVAFVTLWDAHAYAYQITGVDIFAPEELEGDATVQPGEQVEVRVTVETGGQGWRYLALAATRDSDANFLWLRGTSAYLHFLSSPGTYSFQFYAPRNPDTYELLACIRRYKYSYTTNSFYCPSKVQFTVAGTFGGSNLVVYDVRALLSTARSPTLAATNIGLWQTKQKQTETTFWATVENAGGLASAPTIATLYRVPWFGNILDRIILRQSILVESEVDIDTAVVPGIQATGKEQVVFRNIQIPKDIGKYVYYVRISPVTGESNYGDNFSGYSALSDDESVITRFPRSRSLWDRAHYDSSVVLLDVEPTPDLTVPTMYVTEPGRTHEYVLPTDCFRLIFAISNEGSGFARRSHVSHAYLLRRLYGQERWFLTSTRGTTSNCAISPFTQYGPYSHSYPFWSSSFDDQFPSENLAPGEGVGYDFITRIPRLGRYQYRIGLVTEEHTRNDPRNNIGPIVTIEVVPELPDLAVSDVDILGQQAEVVRVTPNARVTVRGLVENRATQRAPVPPQMKLTLTSTGSASGEPLAERIESVVPHSGQSQPVFLEAVTPSRLGSNVSWLLCATSITNEVNRTNNCHLVRLSVLEASVVSPSPPILLSAEGGRNRVALTWLPPLRNGGSRISAFTIESSVPGSDTWNTIATVSDLPHNHQYTHIQRRLQDGQIAQYRIVAQNQSGTSDPSNVMRTTTSDPYSANLVADFNRDGVVGEGDAHIFYLSHQERQLLGNGSFGGTANNRRDLLHSLLARDVLYPDDSDYRELIRRANENRIVGSQPILDINQSGTVDSNDASIMYHVLSFPELVGNGNTGGFEIYRRIFLKPHHALSDASDSDLKALIRRALDLRTVTYGSN